ncbi:uncharacterized protein HKW66_Vig0247610 [Vigna angularis]|uniref:Uncharacterized protein n=1 Tax=Phaseolus angularis TaxID=3914 RepID=A0A8T0KUJ2_PHAAN|nr:uncharacterized protein HKW66_Vig0247610 [Vigna angularis]
MSGEMFEVVVHHGALKDMGYLQVKELYYNVQHLSHKLYDDRGAINMVKVANVLGKVDLYGVHGVNHVEVVEDDVNKIYVLCEAEAHGSSGEGSGVVGEEDEIKLNGESSERERREEDMSAGREEKQWSIGVCFLNGWVNFFENRNIPDRVGIGNIKMMGGER